MLEEWDHDNVQMQRQINLSIAPLSVFFRMPPKNTSMQREHPFCWRNGQGHVWHAFVLFIVLL